jgi:hypothetical protein
VRADAARRLLPSVRDNGWFFDTELLVLAQEHGMRIHEVPVDWTDDPDSRVDIVSTVVDDLKGIARLLAHRPIARFMAIGVVSTLTYAVLYLLLRTWLAPAVSNAIALAITAIANTQANRAFTFGLRAARAFRLLQHFPSRRRPGSRDIADEVCLHGREVRDPLDIAAARSALERGRN